MVFKIIHIVILASVKYILTLPYAMLIGVEYKYAILSVLAGGIGGFLLFFYLSKPLNRLLDRIWPHFCKAMPASFKNRFQLFCNRQFKKPAKRFSRRNRFMVRVKTTYGLWGIIIATPVILTIPFGAFLANKYYGRRKNVVTYMILSIVGWGLVLSGVVHLFPNVFF
jgi:hypothetical protein